jgi:hypothetical protein
VGNRTEMKDKVGVYYKIGSYEMGLQNTGKRSANYHCWIAIYDKGGVEIKGHSLSDCFSGKWAKCSTVINKWRKSMKKNNLTQKIN